MAERKIDFTLLGNASSAVKAFAEVGKSNDSLSAKLTGIGKVAGKAFAVTGVTAVASLGAALVSGIKDAANYQVLANQTAAAIKSTGGAAGVTVPQLESMAGSLESLSGVDEELILHGENVLLTFTNLKNGVGAGNDVFNQATKVALDMSSALGQDMQSSAILVGKALNDPVKGLTALTRVGVSFTDAQKKQIAALEKSGDTMGAQKIILGELNREFGGAAKAAGQGFSGSLARLKDVIGDTFRNIGMKLIPILSKLADWGAKELPKAFGVVSGIFKRDILPILTQVAGIVMANVVPAFHSIGDFITSKLVPALQLVGQWFQGHILPILQQVASVIFGQLLPIIASLWQWFATRLIPVVLGIWEVIAQKLKPVLDALVNVFKTDVLPTVELIIARFNQWKPTIEAVIVTVEKIIGKVLEFVATILGKVLPPLLKFVGWLLKNLIPVLLNIVEAVAKVIGKFIEFGIKVAHVFSDIKDDVTTAVKWVTDKFDSVVDFFTKLPGRISSAVTGMWDGIKDAFKSAINWIIDKWNGLQFSIPGVDTHIPGVGKIGGFTLGTPDIPRLAVGTRFFAGGTALVGEQGPELVNLPRGSQVLPAGATAAALGGSGSREIVRAVDNSANRLGILLSQVSSRLDDLAARVDRVAPALGNHLDGVAATASLRAQTTANRGVFAHA